MSGKLIAVVPCLNEEKFISKVVFGLSHYFDEVVVVDNGSVDSTVSLAKKAGASVILTEEEKGYGKTLATGVRYCLDNFSSIKAIVTVDGDGQHDPRDAASLASLLSSKELDLVVGNRLSNGYSGPFYRRVGNIILSELFNFGSSFKFNDSQSGLRAFSAKLALAIKWNDSGFGSCIEQLAVARFGNFSLAEWPIGCTYHKKFSDNSSSSPVSHGLVAVISIVKWRTWEVYNRFYSLQLRILNYLKLGVYKLFKLAIKPLVGYGLSDRPVLGSTYRYLVKFIIPSTERTVEINGYKLKLKLGNGRDIGGISQLLIFDKKYEDETTCCVKSLVRPSMLVIDIGANVGYYTMLMSKLVGREGRVLAFEPEARNYSDLLENIELNSFSNILTFKSAVSSSNGTGKLNVSRFESGEHSLVISRDKKGYTEEVEVVSLDSILKDDRCVDFIKIDTEGNEVEVLLGARDLLARSPSIKLVVEVWPKGLDAAGYSFSLLWNLLDELGFSYKYLLDEWNMTSKEATPELVEAYIKKRGFGVNILCSKYNLKEEL